MKLNGLVSSNKVRIVFWTVVAGSFAVAVAAPWPGGGMAAAGKQTGRKSTDPPVAAKGKLGQDLFLAIDRRDLPGVQALIKRGADPNARNGLEFTPLFIAAASFQPDVIQALLSAGAKADARSTYGTALTFAAMSGDVPGANLLLAHGASVSAPRGDGMTVLMMASLSGSPEFVGELLKRKADVNAEDDNGSTALSLAARAGNVEAGRLLLAAGAKVDAADGDRQTPLMAAAATGHPDFVRMLLQKGANPKARDSKGRTALFLAAAYGDYPEVVKALLEGGADPKVPDDKGRTAASLARQRGYPDCAALLGQPTPGGIIAAGRVRDPREAVNGSLKILTSSMLEFNRMTSCVSCHQEGLGRVATGAARDRGFHVDPAADQEQAGRINGMLSGLRPLHEQALQNPEVMKQIPLIEINEVADTYGWLLSGMAAHHQAPTEGSAAMAMVLARQQSPDGHWGFSVPRVPLQSSFFTFTALAIRSLSVYGPKSHGAEIAVRVGRAKAWLLHSEAKSSEDRASQLLGLKWAGASADERQKLVEAVRADQKPDGGWSQLPDLHCDAYATGQALYALHEAGGLPVTDPVYKRGVQFLLRTQDDDGSWFVNKRAIPANNYFDSGFPHGESQYASFNGTCWATLALMETIAPQTERKR